MIRNVRKVKVKIVLKTSCKSPKRSVGGQTSKKAVMCFVTSLHRSYKKKQKGKSSFYRHIWSKYGSGIKVSFSLDYTYLELPTNKKMLIKSCHQGAKGRWNG